MKYRCTITTDKNDLKEAKGLIRDYQSSSFYLFKLRLKKKRDIQDDVDIQT